MIVTYFDVSGYPQKNLTFDRIYGTIDSLKSNYFERHEIYGKTPYNRWQQHNKPCILRNKTPYQQTRYV